MSNTLHQQFQTFLNSLQNAYAQSMDALTSDALTSDTSMFNHVAVLPDCPVMWSADDDSLGTDWFMGQSNTSADQATQPPSTSVVQYHYHYYSFSGFVSSLVTIGAVCSGTIFILLVWVGLVQIRGTFSPSSVVEDDPGVSQVGVIYEPGLNLYG